ncbi:JHBP [Nesidiocoris tenuis]|uniref:JHBP n=1 Tax=Nesidiocoris tenuis TaxID=355587 RepID=A0ABN7B4F7_9HEMI|nr:JHBP [Nesidiocoris tenuis]
MTRPEIVVFLLGLSISLAVKLPEEWPHCAPGKGFPECMKRAVETAVKSMGPAGLPSFGVLPLDPMHFDSLLIDQSTGPVAVKLEFKNLDVTGIKDLVVSHLEGDWTELHAVAQIPVPVILYGDYSVQGKVLTLPIMGNGKCNLTFHDFKWDPIDIKFHQEAKKGKNYIQIKEIDLNPQASLLEMQFDGLFNGDKLLGDNMNMFLNENWKEIFSELKVAVSKGFSTAYKNVGNRILSKIPADVIMAP